MKKKLTIIIIAVGMFAGIGTLGLKLSIMLRFQSAIYSIQAAPSMPGALVFGAGLWYDGAASTVMMNCVSTAVALYKQGSVETLIMSGDGRNPQFDETAAMRRLAIDTGVPSEDIIRDPAGIRTYDSCYHTLHTYNAEKLILVTHSFHLYRALYTCHKLGIDVIGVAPQENPTIVKSLVTRELREIAATILAWWELNIMPPQLQNHLIIFNLT